jgi:hypothetical protein
LWKNSKSGVKGVSRDKRGWCAKISRLGVAYPLGFFKDKYDAARAYDAKAIELFGPDAVTNKSLGLIPPLEAKCNEPTPAEPKLPSTIEVRGLRKDSKSGCRGCSWHPGVKKWQVAIQKDGKQVHVGYFTDLLDAAKAYDKKARELFGEFASTNFPVEANPVFAPPSPSEPQSQEAPAPVSETLGPPLSS